MHTYDNWPDEFFDQVSDAAYEIGTFLARWGRIGVTQIKEKYGTARVYCHLGWDCFYSIFFPRHCWIKPWWPYRLDLTVSRFVMPLLNRLVIPYQKWIYRKAYSQAANKYSHLTDEILVMADFGELLDGIAGYRYADHWKNIGE